MIIDRILDRRDAEAYGDFEYNAHDFYMAVMGYGSVGFGITIAMDYGTEAGVKQALCEYIREQGYNRRITDYINARVWLENTNEVLPLVDILN